MFSSGESGWLWKEPIVMWVGWLWKEPVNYWRCSNWRPFAFTHARSRAVHWSTDSKIFSPRDIHMRSINQRTKLREDQRVHACSIYAIAAGKATHRRVQPVQLMNQMIRSCSIIFLSSLLSRHRDDVPVWQRLLAVWFFSSLRRTIN